MSPIVTEVKSTVLSETISASLIWTKVVLEVVDFWIGAKSGLKIKS